MPIRQSLDVAAPVEQVWKLWNKYENYPKFMHRLESAEKLDPKRVHFRGKIWRSAATGTPRSPRSG